MPERPGQTDLPPGEPDALARLTAEIGALRREVADLRLLMDHLPGESPTSFDHDDDEDDPQVVPLAHRFRTGGSVIRTQTSKAVDRPRTAGLRLASWYWSRHTAREWQPSHPRLWDALAIVVVSVAAFLLRFINVANNPPGLHGDEAATGILARAILKSGWIGVYSGRAGGNPTGDYYLVAPFLKWISDPILAVRLLSVVGGTIAVVALYILARRNMGFMTAIIASSLLAISEWAIEFGRTGFVTGNWLPFALVGTICLMEGIRSGKWYWWIATGVTMPSAIYIYNGHAPVLLLILPFVAVTTLGIRSSIAVALFATLFIAPSNVTIAISLAAFVFGATDPRWRRARTLVNTASFLIPALLVSKGMIKFIQTHPNDYFGRSRQLSVFRTDDWQSQSSNWDKVHFLLDRYRMFWDRVTFKPFPNGVDLTGVTSQIPGLMFWFCLIGLVLALLLRPTWLVLFSSVIIVLAPMSAAFTDMATRRALIILPFACLVAGIGAYEVVRLLYQRRKYLGAGAALVLLCLLVRIGQENYVDFFDTTVKSQPVARIFAVDYRTTLEYATTLPRSDYIIFFNNGALLTYDSGQLIAPDIRGEDRLPKWGGDGSYSIDRTKGDPVFLLMGDHTSEIGAIQALYPGGTVVTGPIAPFSQDVPSYVAYFLPPQSTAMDP